VSPSVVAAVSGKMPLPAGSIPSISLSLTMMKKASEVVASDEELALRKLVPRRIVSSMLVLVLYLIVTVVLYWHLEDWSPGDSLYYAIVVVTTTGYGDLLPTSNSSKIVTVLFIFVTLSSIGFAITTVTEELVTRTFRRLRIEAATVGLLDQSLQVRRRRLNMAVSLSFFGAVLLAGTIFFALDEFNEEEVGNRWVNGLYLTVITVTTVGFGDLTPSTDQGKAFACIIMLTGIPACLAVLRTLTEAIHGAAQTQVRLKLLHGLSSQKFETLEKFVEEMHARELTHCLSLAEGKVSRFDFLCFVLVENGLISMDNLQETLLNFDELDKSNTGFIELIDIT